jgi:hypothetical protein
MDQKPTTRSDEGFGPLRSARKEFPNFCGPISPSMCLTPVVETRSSRTQMVFKSLLGHDSDDRQLVASLHRLSRTAFGAGP